MGAPRDQAVTATVERVPVELLIEAYANGRFPMAHADGELYWHDPDPRSIFPLDLLVADDRTERDLRTGKFRVSIDEAFEQVVRSCADRSETWIDERMIASYVGLHQAGHAHSVEAWKGGQLVGGIYGVALGGAFFGESMFHRANNAGKVVFHTLVRHLRERGFVLFDSQYINPFTKKLGAIEVPRPEFMRSLSIAVRMPDRFLSDP